MMKLKTRNEIIFVFENSMILNLGFPSRVSWGVMSVRCVQLFVVASALRLRHALLPSAQWTQGCQPRRSRCRAANSSILKVGLPTPLSPLQAFKLLCLEIILIRDNSLWQQGAAQYR